MTIKTKRILGLKLGQIQVHITMTCVWRSTILSWYIPVFWASIIKPWRQATRANKQKFIRNLSMSLRDRDYHEPLSLNYYIKSKYLVLLFSKKKRFKLFLLRLASHVTHNTLWSFFFHQYLTSHWPWPFYFLRRCRKYQERADSNYLVSSYRKACSPSVLL